MIPFYAYASSSNFILLDSVAKIIQPTLSTHYVKFIKQYLKQDCILELFEEDTNVEDNAIDMEQDLGLSVA